MAAIPIDEFDGRSVELRVRQTALVALSVFAFLPGPLHVPSLRPAVRTGQLAVEEQSHTGFLGSPGPRSSWGMRRATAASMNDVSLDVKSAYGPGVMPSGALAVLGVHGMCPDITRSYAADVRTTFDAHVPSLPPRNELHFKRDKQHGCLWTRLAAREAEIPNASRSR